MVYIFAVSIYSEYEQLTPIYGNVSGTSKKKLLQYGHQIFNVFSNIVNCFWKGVNIIEFFIGILKSENYSYLFNKESLNFSFYILKILPQQYNTNLSETERQALPEYVSHSMDEKHEIWLAIIQRSIP